MLVTFTNASSSTIYVSSLYTQIEPGASVTTRRTLAQLDADQYLKDLIAAGTLTITTAEEASDVVISRIGHSAVASVLDYGAIGDGATDDTAAIQAAADAISLFGSKGGTVYFPPGKYLVTSKVTISADDSVGDATGDTDQFSIEFKGAGGTQSQIIPSGMTLTADASNPVFYFSTDAGGQGGALNIEGLCFVSANSGSFGSPPSANDCDALLQFEYDYFPAQVRIASCQFFGISGKFAIIKDKGNQLICEDLLFYGARAGNTTDPDASAKCGMITTLAPIHNSVIRDCFFFDYGELNDDQIFSQGLVVSNAYIKIGGGFSTTALQGNNFSITVERCTFSNYADHHIDAVIPTTSSQRLHSLVVRECGGPLQNAVSKYGIRAQNINRVDISNYRPNVYKGTGTPHWAVSLVNVGTAFLRNVVAGASGGGKNVIQLGDGSDANGYVESIDCNWDAYQQVSSGAIGYMRDVRNGALTAVYSTAAAGAVAVNASTIVKVTAPAAKSSSGVHAGFAGNDASNDFPGPFTNPGIPRNLRVTFAASWDGGDVVVVGTDQFGSSITETFTSGPGTTVVGVKAFKTVVSATKGAVGASTDTASIGTGDALGAGVDIASAFGIMTADGTAEAVTVDATNNTFTPTTAPDGAVTYVLQVNVSI